MTKSEARELAKLDALAKSADARNHIDYLARGYSALIRAAATKSTRNGIIMHAGGLPAVVQHPEFIV